MKKLYSIILAILILLTSIWNIDLSANAKENYALYEDDGDYIDGGVSYTVTDASAMAYAGDGAEVFAQPDPTTYVTSLAVNTPVQITGVTSNGFFRVSINGGTYFIFGQALSNIPNTTAYKLLSFNAAEALVGDATTGQIIYNQNGLTPMAPASTTKIMTALLVIEAIERGQISLDTPIVVSASALSNHPNDASHVNPKLQAGEVVNVYELLMATMLSSDCYACDILAEAVAGNVPNFVALMNQRAASLGCVNTNFVNTSGYPAKNHYSNAYSLFLIMKEALKHNMFRTIIATREYAMPATNMVPARTLSNTNALIQAGAYYNPNCIGGKTGTAKSSGSCLVSAGTKNGKTVIAVILGSGTHTMSTGVVTKEQFSESSRLINIGLGQ